MYKRTYTSRGQMQQPVYKQKFVNMAKKKTEVL